MTNAFAIRVSRRAAAQIDKAVAWWAQNRPVAPNAIREELERVFALLAVHPNLGASAQNTRLGGVRRIHLSRIHYHLYYRVLADAIEVLAFWHTSRGTGPTL